MKQVQFIDDNRNGFYIDNINNDIIVSSFGHSHLFNYPSILVKELDKFSKKISRDNINTYFDLSSVLGESAVNKYFVITYDKTKKDFIYPSKKTLEKLPAYCHNYMADDDNNDAIGRSLKSYAKKRIKITTDDNSKHRRHTESMTGRVSRHSNKKRKRVA